VLAQKTKDIGSKNSGSIKIGNSCVLGHRSFNTTIQPPTAWHMYDRFDSLGIYVMMGGAGVTNAWQKVRGSDIQKEEGGNKIKWYK